MTLTVLNVAYPFAPVTVDPVGGAEQVLAQLDRALVRRGHRSLVIAAEGSDTDGELIRVPAPAGTIDPPTRERAHGAVRYAIAAALARARIDVVHLHGIDFERYLPAPGPSVLVTLHLPLAWYAPSALRPARARTWLLPVSADQARAAPPGLAFLPPIQNGVPLEAVRARRRGFALALGRICPEKGFHDALDAAERAATPLLLAGTVFPYPDHQRYFAAEIAPRLGPMRRWIGPVAGRRKRRLLAQARCVLVSSNVPETSSLAAMEALAAGTPVVAYASGALSELVEHGRTGFVVDGVDAMAEAIEMAGRIDPEDCRRTARDRFSADAMVEAYLATYRRLSA